MGTGQNPPPDKTSPPTKPPPPGKAPLRPKPPHAKIPLWSKTPLRQKAPSGEKKNILSTPLLSLIDKYHPKLKLFYIKLRLRLEDNDILF